MHLTKAFKLFPHTLKFIHLIEIPIPWGQLSISTCFLVNQNLLIFLVPPPKAQAVPAGSAFCFMCPCVSMYRVFLYTGTWVYVWVLLHMYKFVLVGWCCTCNFSFFPLPLTLICLSNLSYVSLCACVCVRMCLRVVYLRVIYFMIHTIHMSRMLRLNAFCNLFCFIWRSVYKYISRNVQNIKIK